MSAALFSIQQLSEDSGVHPVTLRAWERRYGLLQPARTAKGHRRYSEQDRQRVRDILGWLEKGIAVSQVAALLAHPEQSAMPDRVGPWQEVIDSALLALADMNSRALESQLNRLLAEYGHARVIRCFCQPLREQLRLSPLLAGRRLLLDALLQARWSARLLAQAPGKRQFAWLLVPVGESLPALELAMVLNRPLWCLPRPVYAEELTVLLAQRPHCGVLWVLAEQPSRAEQHKLWASLPASRPLACWSPLLPASAMPERVPALHGDMEQLAEQLQALQPAAGAPSHSTDQSRAAGGRDARNLVS